uniref:Uncharacterized protein n=1 Tax=Rhizophora mucronata TaxID=61149 RepID=A0A2P2NCR2_RHIMU
MKTSMRSSGINSSLIIGIYFYVLQCKNTILD